ncbi:MAG TPA: DoxX family protein [Gemmataceae bacterium]|nr:DoxX family protein [Gemmataceae bacterium]
MNSLTRVFLILLRLAIGWHFLFEGIEKIHSVDVLGPTATNRPWTSVSYLREAAGPAADLIKKQVGDPDEEALALFWVKPLEHGQDPAQVPPRQRISPTLDAAWNEYLARFKAAHELTAEKMQQADIKMDQAKNDAVSRLLGQPLGGKETVLEVEKSFNGEATVKVPMTFRQRLEEYRSKLQDLHQIMTQKLYLFGHDVEKQRIPALKAEINRIRAELVDALEKPMKETLDSVLTDEQRKSARPEPPHSSSVSHWKEWTRNDWIDGVTRYGLTAIGVCLIIGLFTRTACLAGACFLILVYLTIPALPWLPESPRAEGHYLFVNKNIIEMLALFTLATTRSGYWLGLDGLLYWLLPWHWRSRRAPRTRR